MSTPIPANAALLSAWAAAAATGGRVVRAATSEGPHGDARGITSDSRAVTEGCAFVALRGPRHDGHEFVDRAMRDGARLVVIERGRAPAGGGADVVEVDDTLVAWGDLARAHVRAWRRAPGHTDRVLFAITGSAGKTTTKELCAALLRSLGQCHATSGNLNNRVGVPAVAFGLLAEHRFGVFEVGMNAPGEIAALAAILEPDVAILTNVGVAHAEGVGGTRGDVAREKGDLFAALSPDAVAVTCFDDPAAFGQLARTRARRAVTFGAEPGSDYRLLERRDVSNVDGARLSWSRGHGSEAQVFLSLPGEAAALDLLAALAAVESRTGPLAAAVIDRAMRLDLRRPAGRMQVRRLRSGTVVLDDSYNANPQSVAASLRSLRELARGRRAVAILGEMRELGALARAEHARLGALAVDASVRLLVSCGGWADEAVREADRAGIETALAPDASGAARIATQRVRDGDVVLVKASRGVGAERVVQALVEAGGGEEPSIVESPREEPS